jgi:hypothetical protein
MEVIDEQICRIQRASHRVHQSANKSNTQIQHTLNTRLLQRNNPEATQSASLDAVRNRGGTEYETVPEGEGSARQRPPFIDESAHCPRPSAHGSQTSLTVGTLTSVVPRTQRATLGVAPVDLLLRCGVVTRHVREAQGDTGRVLHAVPLRTTKCTVSPRDSTVDQHGGSDW